MALCMSVVAVSSFFPRRRIDASINDSFAAAAGGGGGEKLPPPGRQFSARVHYFSFSYSTIKIKSLPLQ